jgi:ABC-type multidrug transport system fused ATPase/permease subunit
MTSTSVLAIASTALIPLASLTSLSLYITRNPSSPIYALLNKRGVQLPTSQNEGLDGNRDAFDLESPLVCTDGIPVKPDQFWRRQTFLKLWLWLSLIPTLAANIALLVLTLVASRGLEEHERLRALLLPILLLPAQLVNLLIATVFFKQKEVPSHWSTTIHLAANLLIQFLVLGMLALLPSTPFPETPISFMTLLYRMDAFSVPPLTAIKFLTWSLPVLHFIPFFIICFIRRGPPMYLPMTEIYPAKVTDAIPAGHQSLNPDIANVTAEVDVTVVEWCLYSYAGEVIERAKVNDSMDVWDLPILPASMRALPNFLHMKRVYGRRRSRLGKMEGFNLLIKLAKVNAGLLTAQTLLAIITAVGYYVPHLTLRYFLRYLELDPGRTDARWGWLLALGLFVTNVTIYIVSGIIWSISSTLLQGRIKLQLNTMLFSKTLLKKDIAAAGDDTGTVGNVKEEAAKSKKKGDKAGTDEEEAVSSKSQIMTLFTVDVDRVSEFVFHAFSIVDSPIEIVVATVMLYWLLGSSAIVGLLASILLMPLSHLASKFVVTAQDNLMKTRDQRTALMNEVLQGIRMLKFMAWERPFESRINKIRNNELSWVARNYQIEVAFNCLWALTPVVVTVVSFIHYTLWCGQTLTPSTAFTSLAVFSELRFALNALPETFIQALQGFVSCRRIEKYMSLAEVPDVATFDKGDIVLTNATYTWPQDDSAAGTKSIAPTPRPAFSLADLTLRFPEGKLSLICGRLGSGKSLLLAGLLGEADLVAGQALTPRSAPNTMTRSGTKILDEDWIIPEMVAYVPQQAWLQNASIKDNIVFSSPWNAERYAAVLEACSLLTDLEILEDGDGTEIGEKGLNLSGGQKARVSLARAVYCRAGVIYLDDVLSAVDAHTAHAIMENCLNGPLMAGRTVLLVSHHTALVSPSAAYIVALENGDVKFAGTRADFVECGLMNELDAEDAEAKLTTGETLEEKTVEQNIAEAKGESKEIKEIKAMHKSVVSLSSAAEPDSETSSLAPLDSGTVTPIKTKAPRKLIEDEKRVRGRIAWSVWVTYFSSLGGPFWWMTFILALIISALAPVAEQGWVTYWTRSDAEAYHPALYYVAGYAIIAITGCFLSNIQFIVVYIGSLRSSRLLHNKMLESVLFATLRFHDTTSRGRLLNRFGKDIEGLDSKMADNFVRSVQYALNVSRTVIVVTYIGGWPFVCAGAIMGLIYYHAGSMYGQASRDMRRLDSVTRSPLYSLFGETVSGVSVIRAFGASTISLQSMMNLSDTNIVSFAWTWTVNRWLSSRFNVLSSILVGVTACAVLIAPGVNAGLAGFALSFAGTILHDLLFVVRRFVQLEQSMVALERIKEYSEVPQEAPEHVDPRPPASWPAEGAVEVKDLVIRYAPDLPDVLHSITFSVKPCEKIGIVGSTGCGKSTLALSFFRFVEATSGRISIDGIDISKIGLTDLRSRIMIIPQDPTILSGTLRSTLDVFDEYTDADIYEAVRRVHLLSENEATGPEASTSAASTSEDTAVEERNANVFRDLSYPVSEGGDNFSSGEKQLICMARAILRRNKVLFMDEATASIDYETDALISKTIRAEFSDSTILTIAHRIHTIIDFDKVLVMHRGSIAEYASPAELLRNSKSRFYALCRATGKTEFANLRQLAFDAEARRKATP